MRRGRGQYRDGARAAYEQATEAGDAHALIDLARMLRGDLGDAEGARAAFQRAIDSGDPALTAEARVDLGYLLMMFPRDYTASRDCFEQAISSGHATRKGGDRNGARAAFQRAADLDNADWSPAARAELLNLLPDRLTKGSTGTSTGWP